LESSELEPKETAFCTPELPATQNGRELSFPTPVNEISDFILDTQLFCSKPIAAPLDSGFSLDENPAV
jgi:hypothetical protein